MIHRSVKDNSDIRATREQLVHSCGNAPNVRRLINHAFDGNYFDFVFMRIDLECVLNSGYLSIVK